MQQPLRKDEHKAVDTIVECMDPRNPADSNTISHIPCRYSAGFGINSRMTPTLDLVYERPQPNEHAPTLKAQAQCKETPYNERSVAE